MPTCFIVRAQVGQAHLREAFDRWYQDEHLPEALKAFGAQRAWRGWSDVDPSLHYAYYEFTDPNQARAVPGSPALQLLVAEFDRVWGSEVKRSRDVLELKQIISQ